MAGKGRKQKLKDGWEWDIAHTYSRAVCGFKAGVAKYTKRRMNKRERKQAKQEVKDE